jgi:hypothetical protein
MQFSRQAMSNYRLRRIEAVRQLKALTLPNVAEVDDMKAADVRVALKQLIEAVEAVRIIVAE